MKQSGKFHDMRNTISIITIILMIAASSCQRAEIFDENHIKIGDILSIGIESQTTETKTYLEKNGEITWAEKDQLIVFNATDKKYIYELDDDYIDMTYGNFRCIEELELNTSERHTFKHLIAVYPKQEDITCNATEEGYLINEFNIPKNQVYVHKSFDSSAFPMIAVGTRESNEMCMSNICGGIKLQLTGDCIVKEITLIGNSSETIAGTANIMTFIDDRKPLIKNWQNKRKEIVLKCEEGVKLDMEIPTTFLITVPPVEFKEGFSIIVTDSEGNDVNLKTTKNKVIESSTILKMPVTSLYEMVFNSFYLQIAKISSFSVDFDIQTDGVLEASYIISENEKIFSNPAEVYENGEKIHLTSSDIIRISNGIEENKTYHLYFVAKLNEGRFSEIKKFTFDTPKFESSELLSLIEERYDGYRMRITLPEPTLKRGNAIRWNQSCIMMYNYMASTDDYLSLLYNGGNYTTENKTLIYSEETNKFQTGEDSDGDGEIDWDVFYNPISPGEPVVFIAGEFSWMEDSPEYETEYFNFPVGWDNGYYLPLINTEYFYNEHITETDYLSRPLDDYWTGAFQRKFFRVKEPDLLNAKVTVELEAVTPANATLNFYPEDGVDHYVFGVFDEHTYNILLNLCMGNEDYLQWAVTSYFAEYTFRTKVATEAVQANLTSFYHQDSIIPETKYIVLITAMGNSAGTSQSFTKFEFNTTEKVKDAPVIAVTPVESKSTPFKATFNIRCTTASEGNPVIECQYAANYLRDWLTLLNEGYSYYSIVKSEHNHFNKDELKQINSPDGYDISISTIDGETTRIAILGYNDEYTPNDLQYDKYTPAVADLTTAYCDPKPKIDPSLYTDLAGEWTATATLMDVEGENVFEYNSKIVIAADLYDYPDDFDSDLYAKFENSDFNKADVLKLWDNFKNLAKEYTEKRLENQNRLIGIGWLDKDSWKRLDYRTPYDLFIATDYSSVDVSSLYNDFGPKWYLEATKNADGTLSYSIPIDSNFLPPASNWSIPFYLGAMQKDTWYTITSGDGWTPAFPVTVSADRNTIIINPLDYDGRKLYPNMIGIDPTFGTILENPVVSEIVLTRGWEGNDKKESAVVRGASRSVQAQGNFPTTTYKERTRLSTPVKLKKIDYKIITTEEFKNNADKLLKETIGPTNH